MVHESSVVLVPNRHLAGIDALEFDTVHNEEVDDATVFQTSILPSIVRVIDGSDATMVTLGGPSTLVVPWMHSFSQQQPGNAAANVLVCS